MALGDLQIQPPRLDPVAPSSADIRINIWRSALRRIFANAQMGTREVKAFCRIGAECLKLLEAAVNKLGFSARAYDRSLKVARTIADLAGAEEISPSHLSEAIQYRAMDRYY